MEVIFLELWCTERSWPGRPRLATTWSYSGKGQSVPPTMVKLRWPDAGIHGPAAPCCPSAGCWP